MLVLALQCSVFSSTGKICGAVYYVVLAKETYYLACTLFWSRDFRDLGVPKDSCYSCLVRQICFRDNQRTKRLIVAWFVFYLNAIVPSNPALLYASLLRSNIFLTTTFILSCNEYTKGSHKCVPI